MTKEQLAQCYQLHRERDQLEERIKRLRAKCEMGSILIDDMPKGGVKRDYSVELADAVLLMEQLRQKLDKEIVKVVDYINNIDNSLARQILSLRYLDGLSWEDIAGKLCYTSAHVQSLHRVYLKKNNL